MSLEHQLWTSLGEGHLSSEEWSAIADRLVETLGDYLQQRVLLVDAAVIDGEALSCSIRSARPIGGPLALAWEGRLGTETIDGTPHVSASLFLFSQATRLAVAGQRGSYIELVFEATDGGGGRWQSLGWMQDVYREFESVDTYTGDGGAERAPGGEMPTARDS